MFLWVRGMSASRVHLVDHSGLQKIEWDLVVYEWDLVVYEWDLVVYE